MVKWTLVHPVIAHVLKPTIQTVSWPTCIGCGKSMNAEISPHFTPRKCEACAEVLQSPVVVGDFYSSL